MTLKNEPRNNHKGWTTSKRALLATTAFIMAGGIAQARVEVDTARNDVSGISASTLVKQYPYVMNDPESLEKLLKEASLEVLQNNLPTNVIDFMKEIELIKDDSLTSATTPQTHNLKSAAQLLRDSDRLSTAHVLDFTKLAYSTNQQGEWTDEEKGIYTRLIAEGWELCPFNGTTGAANNQVESVSGFIAFKGRHVVISTRGTEMTNWNDWLTNFRFSRSPFLRMFSSEEQNKISAATAQHFGGITGEIPAGFLQTHLSSWEAIREIILNHTKSLTDETQTVSPKDLHYTITGHSLGGAKAQLNALKLLTDHILGIGVQEVKSSFIENFDSTIGSFYSPPEYSEPENKGNVEVIVFGSPRVCDQEAAEQIKKILGDDIYRVENNDPKFFKSLDLVDIFGDIVPLLPPSILGFMEVGWRIPDKGKKGISVGRHTMDNVSEEALDDVDAARFVRLLTRKAAEAADSQMGERSAVQKEIKEFKRAQFIARLRDAVANLQKINASKAADDQGGNIITKAIDRIGGAFKARFVLPKSNLPRVTTDTTANAATPAA